MRATQLSRRLPGTNIQLTIRSAEQSDEPFLWEMLYLAIFVPPDGTPLPRSVLQEPAIARYVLNWGTWPGDRGLIAEIDGKPVGAAWLRQFPEWDPGYGYVDAATPELSISVVAEHRGKGIGSALLERLLKNAGAVSLSCDPANPAWHLYLRHGFTPLRDGRTMLRVASHP